MGRTAHGDLFTRPTPRDRGVARTARPPRHRPLAGRPYTLISGGERQLVLVARALAQEPRFVVLDEPTASLDFGNQGKVMREIRRWPREGSRSCSRPTTRTRRFVRRPRPALARRHADCPGPVADVLTRERLVALYQADIVRIGGRGKTAYLPG